MRRLQRQSPCAVLLCALAAACPVLAQDGLRSERAPVRAAYQPIVAAARDFAQASPNGEIRVALIGAVRQPATYLAPAGLSVGNLLGRAGGLSPEAADSLVVIRGGRVQGPYLLDPQDSELAAAGTLRDGDVVVFRSQRGVRRALYQQILAEGAGSRTATGIQDAAQEPLVSIACVGLAEAPVVFHLEPHDANETVLFLQLLQMTPEAVARGVTPIIKATSDQSFPDGTVIAFNRRQLPTDAVRPKYPLPAPRPLPPGPEADPVAPSETAVSQPVSAQPAPVAQTADPSTTAIQQPAIDPATTNLPAHRLNDVVPGFAPYVAQDRVWNGAVDVAAGRLSADVTPASRRAERPVEVLRGLPPVDVSTSVEHGPGERRWPTTPSRSLTHAEFQTLATESGTFSSPGIRAASPAGGPPSSSVPAALEGSPTPATGIPAPQRTDLTVIFGVGAAALLCLAASVLWAREERKRKGFAASPANTATSATTLSMAPQSAVGATVLQELLDNRLPLIEEPTIIERPVRLHGVVVGNKRLIVDAAHPQVAAPHFAVAAGTTNQKRQERYQRHLAAVTSGPQSGRREAFASAPRSMASQGTVRPVRYDVVQPEPLAAESQTSAASPAGERPRMTGSGDLLARVLASLQEAH